MADCAPHDACDPDVCFTAKLAYMRANGGLSIGFQGGREFFNSTTIKTEQARIVAEGRARGNDLVPYSSIHGNA